MKGNQESNMLLANKHPLREELAYTPDDNLANAEIATLLEFLEAPDGGESITGLAIHRRVESIGWYNLVYRVWRNIGRHGTLVPTYDIFESDGSVSSARRLNHLLIHLSLHGVRDLHPVLLNAYNILLTNGEVVLRFIDYPRHWHAYKPPVLNASHTVDRVLFELTRVGFKDVAIRQTNFNAPERDASRSKVGFGEGAFVVLKAFRRRE